MSQGAASLSVPVHLPSLDGWRGVAIFCVLLAHSASSLSAATAGVSDFLLEELPGLGLLGVRIFFAISGFLICWRILEESERTGSIHLRQFYVRRFFRIVPPLLAMLLLILIPVVCGAFSIFARQWLAGLFFVGDYVRVDDGWYLGHLWSLAVEEHFYLLFPLLLVLAGRQRAWHACLLCACAVALWRAVLFKLETSAGTFDGGYFWGRTDVQADGLLWGCMVAFLYRSARCRALLQACLGPAIWCLLLALILISVFRQHRIEDWKVAMALYSCQAVVIPLILVGTVLRPQGKAASVLALQPLRWLGRRSYSTYLWQQFLLVPAVSIAMPCAWLQQFPMNVLACLVLAFASHRFIEVPSVRLGRRLASQPAISAYRS